MRPYALQAGEGRTYRYDIKFTVKAGELQPGRGATFLEYTTRKGEEPPMHTHPTEDELFYVLKGNLTFRCGDETFEVSEGGFVYLPQGISHGYTIRSDEEVHLIVITFSISATAGQGWSGFVADIEQQGELINKSE
ncbi:MAG: cupin domain-containing protein [Anaerolineae bacterium]|nr:cupin domain-containing protein [Anaerolineae bacterium]